MNLHVVGFNHGSLPHAASTEQKQKMGATLMVGGREKGPQVL